MSFIHSCCPDCGTKTLMHNSWCGIHLTRQDHPNLPLDPNIKNDMKKSLLKKIDVLTDELRERVEH